MEFSTKDHPPLSKQGQDSCTFFKITRFLKCFLVNYNCLCLLLPSLYLSCRYTQLTLQRTKIQLCVTKYWFHCAILKQRHFTDLKIIEEDVMNIIVSYFIFKHKGGKIRIWSESRPKLGLIFPCNRVRLLRTLVVTSQLAISCF